MGDVETNYREALEYLYDLQKYGIKFGLSKTRNLLRACGDPHKGKRYVHIAGTNGKGSVGSMLASILAEAGWKVGLYSSPHLVRFTERFKINNREISRETVVRLLRSLRNAVIPEEPPTFFELTTAMALLYFALEKPDLTVMEVGMGGRLDATNVIRPTVTVITNISMEHQDFLGRRLMDIAGEKAGIIKSGVDLVTGVHQEKVIEAFRSVCHQKGAPFWRIGKDFRYRLTRSGFRYYGVKRRISDLKLGLQGKFQARNAALALCVLEILEEKGVGVSIEHVRRGLQKVSWPGRMQVVSRNPLILLDGAHNPAAIKALADSVRSDFHYDRLILVMGVMADKDIPHMLKGIVPLSDYVIYTRPVYARAAQPEDIMKKGVRFLVPGETVPVLSSALDRARELAGPEDMIVVFGSLFTVGEALTYFDPELYKPDPL